jgi:cysteine-rich secretory family protein
MRLLRRGLTVLALAGAFLVQTGPATAEPLHDSVLQSVNAYRSAHGLPTVTASPTLQAAAQFMAENVASYGPPPVPHVSSDGRTMVQRLGDAGYPVTTTWTAEIIAWGATSSAAAMTLWLNSPSHAAVLNDPRYIAAGFGVACYGAYPCAWVVDFGSLVDRTFTTSPAAPAPVAPAPAPSYHAAFYGESASPVASPGQVVQWVIAFTNTGLTGWSTSGNEARLGTQSPQDAPSFLASGSWVAPNRPARQTTTYVGPGQQAWFIVDLVAPAQPGTYRLYVRPVIDGITWLEDVGAYVDLVVR